MLEINAVERNIGVDMKSGHVGVVGIQDPYAFKDTGEQHGFGIREALTEDVVNEEIAQYDEAMESRDAFGAPPAHEDAP